MALPLLFLNYEWLLSIEGCEWFLKVQGVRWTCWIDIYLSKLIDVGTKYGFLKFEIYPRLLNDTAPKLDFNITT